MITETPSAGWDAIVFDGTNLLTRGGFALLHSRPDATAAEIITLTATMIAGWNKRMGIDTNRAIVCFDGMDASARRRAIFPGYKAGRNDKEPAVTAAIAEAPDSEEIAASCRTVACVDGYEADDTIATYAELLDARGLKVLIVSADKDLLQMVRPRITVANFGLKMTEATMYTPPVFEKKYGFMAPLIADYKALVGDTSDKIPGVTGIGAGTATKLITGFGCIEEIYAAGADRIRALIGTAYTDRLLTGYDDAQKFLSIVTLDTAVPGIQLKPKRKS